MSLLRFKPRFDFSFEPYVNMLERRNACLGLPRINQHYTPMAINQNYNRVIESCHQFYQNHGLVNTEKDLHKLNKVNTLKFAAYGLPDSNSKTLRGYTQFIAWMWYYDDIIEKVPIKEANVIIDDVLNVIQSIKDCNFVKPENVYSAFFQEIMNYLFDISCYDNIEDYFQHPMTQYFLDETYKWIYTSRLTLNDRHESTDISQYSFEDYCKLRAEDSGTIAGISTPLCITQDKWFQSYEFMKSCKSESVIHDIMEDNLMKDVQDLVTKSIILDNDIMGFEKELNVNDFTNYVIILANQMNNENINEALEQTIDLNIQVKEQYITTRNSILEKYDNNMWLKNYLEISDAWALNSLDWYLDTFRYSEKISL